MFASCNKNDDPYNDYSSTNIGIPKNFVVQNCGIYVLLSWDQNVYNIDSVQIEKSVDSINWVILDTIHPKVHLYIDDQIKIGEIFYRINSLAKNINQHYCYCSLVIDCLCDESRFGNFTDERDSHQYRTIQIGTQTWMAENLAYLPEITQIGESSSSIPGYHIQDYYGINVSEAIKTDNYKNFGVLYNYRAAFNSCPIGWHLPSIEDWDILDDYLTTNGYRYIYSRNKSTDINYDNKIAKSLASNDYWNISTVRGAIGNDILINNTSCFSALPGGRFYIGHFEDINNSGYWWSTTYRVRSKITIRSLNFNSENLNTEEMNEISFLSVRCLKD